MDDRFWITDSGRAALRIAELEDDLHMHNLEFRRERGPNFLPRLVWGCTTCDYTQVVNRSAGNVSVAVKRRSD